MIFRKPLKQGSLNEPYLIINIIFGRSNIADLFILRFFSPDKNSYPVVCIHEKITGEPCVSCGLSHSFSLIVRGRIEEAYKWNHYGMRIFLFFALAAFNESLPSQFSI